MKNILVLENNQTNKSLIVEALSEVGKNLKIYAMCNITEAYKIAMTRNIELFVVDIILDKSVRGDVSGIEFVDRVRKIENYKYVPIIILSTIEDPKFYALNNLHCYSYLEKPVNMEVLKRILKEALAVPVMSHENEYVYFRKDGVLYCVLKNDILYIETANRKNKIICKKEEINVTYRSCKTFLEELDSKLFIQCNRNTIVNKKYIKSVDYVNRYIYLKEFEIILELGIIMKKRFLQELMNK